MSPATHAWLDGLREAAATSRRGSGAAPAEDPAVVAAEQAILATHLATWLDATPTLCEARRKFARSSGGRVEPDAAIVLTTSPTGLAVAEEILGRDEPLAREMRPRIACTTEPEYRAWCMRHPDDGHLLHVNHWSWIKTRVPPQRHAEFARHPLRDGEHYWLHRTGTAGAGTADGRAAHLWKFTGRHAALLEPFVAERRVDPSGA